jgi:conjugal transfer pilus assembly protein TraV
MKKLIVLCLITLTCGCAGVLPYEDDVSCRLSDNYGMCMSIQDTYNGGKAHRKDLQLKPGKTVNPEQSGEPVQDSNGALSSRDLYIDNYYREISSLIREPETPLIRQPKQMRTLILSYSDASNQRTLYMPRYIYSIVEDPKYILHDYFRVPERDALILSPKD